MRSLGLGGAGGRCSGSPKTPSSFRSRRTPARVLLANIGGGHGECVDALRVSVDLPTDLQVFAAVRSLYVANSGGP